MCAYGSCTFGVHRQDAINSATSIGHGRIFEANMYVTHIVQHMLELC